FRDKDGNPYTLSGRKDVEDDPGFDAWSDTTTLFTHIYKEHVEQAGEQDAEIYASGILKIYMQDFLKQLTTFRTEGPTLHDRIAALNRFGQFFFGKLWDVYARHFMEYGPF
ncbi:alpha/beta hydrolase, partial [Acidobacteria bacterium AH-259-G07]|nr:alpha/beta hydrolase [Acidobacteria bacterium AH-259-G07]